MTEPEKFLTRWLRRKRQGADDDVDIPATRSMPETSATPNESAVVAEKDLGEPTLDLASLPPIESITAQTDIRAFLAPGVPGELAVAALRRAWSVDPAIRDFIGLAEYAWDFHTPGSMPGFGPLEMTNDLRRVAARILGDSPAETDAARSRNIVPSDQNASDQSPSDQNASDRSVVLAVPDQALGPSVELSSGKVVAENDSQHESDDSRHESDNVSRSMAGIDVAQRKADGSVIKTIGRRSTHGRALPR